MEDYETLQQLLEQLEREIKDLKTSHSLSPSVKTFSSTITPTSTGTLTITYSVGQSPIISDSYTYSNSILSTISNNTQKLFYNGQASMPVMVASTRPILSITQ